MGGGEVGDDVILVLCPFNIICQSVYWNMLKHFVNQTKNILFKTAPNNLQFYYFQHDCPKQ